MVRCQLLIGLDLHREWKLTGKINLENLWESVCV